jgi:hypothetical protein
VTDPIALSEEFNQLVTLTCEARVGSERIEVRENVLSGVYRDRNARQAIEAQIRYRLMIAILERWKPKITVGE